MNDTPSNKTFNWGKLGVPEIIIIFSGLIAIISLFKETIFDDSMPPTVTECLTIIFFIYPLLRIFKLQNIDKMIAIVCVSGSFLSALYTSKTWTTWFGSNESISLFACILFAVGICLYREKDELTAERIPNANNIKPINVHSILFALILFSFLAPFLEGALGVQIVIAKNWDGPLFRLYSVIAMVSGINGLLFAANRTVQSKKRDYAIITCAAVSFLALIAMNYLAEHPKWRIFSVWKSSWVFGYWLSLFVSGVCLFVSIYEVRLTNKTTSEIKKLATGMGVVFTFGLAVYGLNYVITKFERRDFAEKEIEAKLQAEKVRAENEAIRNAENAKQEKIEARAKFFITGFENLDKKINRYIKVDVLMGQFDGFLKEFGRAYKSGNWVNDGGPILYKDTRQLGQIYDEQYPKLRKEKAELEIEIPIEFKNVEKLFKDAGYSNDQEFINSMISRKSTYETKDYGPYAGN